MAFVKKHWVWVFAILLACLLSTVYLVFRTPEEPDREPPTHPAPTITPVPTETSQDLPDQREPTQAPRPPSALTISRIQSAASVSLYDRFELRFAIDGTVATNLQWPYDPGPVTGMSPGSLATGITVDGLFLPPGVTDWAAGGRPAGFLIPAVSHRQEYHCRHNQLRMDLPDRGVVLAGTLCPAAIRRLAV